jgi:signal recognition particle subunit SEC65
MFNNNDDDNKSSAPIPEVLMFDDKIRRITHDGIEYFSLIDLMSVFSNTKAAGQYWRDTKKRITIDGFEVQEKILRLKMTAQDGKRRATDCADGFSCLRIIQSIPSPKAEEVRQWFARLGYERLEETANPELGINRAINRAALSYAANDKSPAWIESRLMGKMSRMFFTERLFNILKELADFAHATDNIYRGTLGYSTEALRKRLGITNPKRDEIRDKLSIPALNALSTAEYLCALKLSQYADDETLPDNVVYATILEIAQAVGLENREIERIMNGMGLDYLTGLPLLKKGHYDYE